MLKIIKCLFVIMMLQVFVSCDTYSTEDLISEGLKIKNEDFSNFNKLIEIADSLNPSPCIVCQISTSRSTSYFSFISLKYNDDTSFVIEDEMFEYDEHLEKRVRDNMPYENCSDFRFMKKLYVTFPLDFHRDKRYNYASLIYCMDKDKLLKLLPKLIAYDNKTIKNLIDDSEHWIYFYDDKWAVSTSSLVYKTSKEDCNQIMLE